MEWRKMRRFRQQLTEEECIDILKKEWRGGHGSSWRKWLPVCIPVRLLL